LLIEYIIIITKDNKINELYQYEIMFSNFQKRQLSGRANFWPALVVV
jgi:hypothetical protein